MDKFPAEEETDDVTVLEKEVKDPRVSWQDEMRDLRRNSEFHRLNHH